jgi:hypothetical protein
VTVLERDHGVAINRKHLQGCGGKWGTRPSGAVRAPAFRTAATENTLRSLRKTNYFTFAEYRVMFSDEGTSSSGDSQPLQPDQRPSH